MFLTQEQMARAISTGIIRALGYIVAACLVVSLLFNCFRIGTDDTDISAWNRSGVSVVTDAKTGLQYLRTSGGGITPRIGLDGRQIMVDPQE